MKNRILNSVPDATLIGSILIALVLDWTLPIKEVIPSPINFAGWVLVVAGIFLAVRTLSLIRSRGASSDVVKLPAVLIADSLYLFSRNPLYLAELLVILGAAFVLGSLSAFVAPVVYVVVLDFFVIPFEEKELQRKFGDNYAQYKRLVRRWV